MRWRKAGKLFSDVVRHTVIDGSLRRANSEVLETSSIALGLQRTVRISWSVGLVDRMSSSLIKVGLVERFQRVGETSDKQDEQLVDHGWLEMLWTASRQTG